MPVMKEISHNSKVERIKRGIYMYTEFCDIYSPNAEKQEYKPVEAVVKYTRIALIKNYIRKVLGKNNS